MKKLVALMALALLAAVAYAEPSWQKGESTPSHPSVNHTQPHVRQYQGG